MSIDLSVVIAAGPKAILVIALGLVARSAGVMLATWPSKMHLAERIFCVIAYLPKATVQAALGGVALSYGLKEGHQVLAIAVLSIIFTAPLGLIGIRIGSRKLLGT
jgi:NhaP-type Na+/H+ or K+/H+ antiporter